MRLPVVGIGKGENFLASDPSPLVGHTKEIVFLEDGQVAKVTCSDVELFDLDQQKTDPKIEQLEWSLEQAQRGDYPHFMLKEIYEGPDVIRSAMQGRIKDQETGVKLGGLEQVAERLDHIKRILILACGTSYYAGLIGEYLFEEIAGIPTEVHIASEFRYRKEPLEKDTATISLSQSGETADTLAAMRKAKEHNLLSLGVVNVVGSTIARETDAGVYNHAGPEIGVASTKAFLSQLSVLSLISIYLSKKIDQEFREELLREVKAIPEKITHILNRSADIKKMAEKYKDYEDFLFIGRKYNYPVALEGALKLKEISYVHAEGYSAGEMKHGPIAMIDKTFPVFAIATDNDVTGKMLSNLEEVIAIVPEFVDRLADIVASNVKRLAEGHTDGFRNQVNDPTVPSARVASNHDED